MLELWVVVAVGAAFMKPTYQALQKKAVVSHPALEVTQFTYVITAVAAVGASIVLQADMLSVRDAAVAAGIGATNSIGLYAFTVAVREEALSIVSPLQQTIPIFAAIL